MKIHQPNFNFIQENTEDNGKIKVLSLFSGCGGMDIGLEGGFSCLKRSINLSLHEEWVKKINGDWVELVETGFQTVFANDIRNDAKATWCSYFDKKKKNTNEIYHLGSIVEIVKRFEQFGEDVFPKNIDIVTGGFPCQDFSVAGKRLGFNSTCGHDGKLRKAEESPEESRGQLYAWMKKVITITKPKMFIAENVKGLTNLHDAKQIIEQDFSNAANGGYLVLPAKVLHAADYGVPQSRERVIFFGFKKCALTDKALKELSKADVSEEYNPYPPKTHAFTVQKNAILEDPVTCEEAFINLSEPQDSIDISQQKFSKAKYQGKHCQGQTEIRLNSIGPTIRSEHHGNIEYRRLSEEHGGCYVGELQSGCIERRLTVRECARIQTFPDDYQFIIPAKKGNVPVSASKAYVVIGNAVPCVLAYNIAMNLKKKWHSFFGKDGEYFQQ